jgi:hypothetical protein
MTKCKLWSDEDTRYLLKAAGVLKVEVIAKHLKRTVDGVKRKASKQGIMLKVKSK